MFRDGQSGELCPEDGRSGEGCCQGNGGLRTIAGSCPREIGRAEMSSSTEGSEEGPGSGHFRRSWLPADEKIRENPRHGASSIGSSGGSRRSFNMLPPLPFS